jgi:galactose mutarotase-like enzyme
VEGCFQPRGCSNRAFGLVEPGTARDFSIPASRRDGGAAAACRFGDSNYSLCRFRFTGSDQFRFPSLFRPPGNPQTPIAAQLGDTGYDSGFALSDEQATFSIAGNGYSIAIEFKSGFRFAQIFAPKDKEFIAIEPMTAATNALCSGEGLRMIAPGEQFTASFRIQVYHQA